MNPPQKKTQRPAGTARRASPRKKRTRRKKNGGFVAALCLAFCVGIALPLAALFFVGGPGAFDLRNYVAASGNAAGQAASSAVRAHAKPSAAEKSAGPSAGRALSRNGSAAGSSGRAAAGKSGGGVTGALVDLKSLPYEESLNASLDERIRQVDYALMQASWLKKLPASAMRLVSVEDRLEGIEPYQYQIIDILPGKQAKEYTDALRSSLAAWAEGAALHNQGDNHWLIVIHGVQTHHIRLFPGKEHFPPLPGKTEGAASPPGQLVPQQESAGDIETFPSRPGVARPSFRAAGEEARMVIVMDDLGANLAAVRQLLALDYPVTLAFWPHGNHTRQGSAEARQAGREILIHQPMEPLGYPRVDPGPNALLVGMPPERIRALLDLSFAAVPHAVGLNNHMGSRFTRNSAGVDAVIDVLRQRGMFALDSRTHGASVFASEARRLGLEHYQRDVFLDVSPTRRSILHELRQAERIALITGRSIAIGHPLPETLAALNEWQTLRNKEVRLVTLRELNR
jgi:polysaccharide deacetylase 2 family uncharacterized protein YibQ